VSQTLEYLTHPKDSLWSSFDSHAAVLKPVRFLTLLWLISADRRDGRFIERIGFYNPLAKGAAESLRIAQDRLTHWTGVGAQCSPTVVRLVKQAAKAAA